MAAHGVLGWTPARTGPFTRLCDSEYVEGQVSEDSALYGEGRGCIERNVMTWRPSRLQLLQKLLGILLLQLQPCEAGRVCMSIMPDVRLHVRTCFNSRCSLVSVPRP